MSFSAEITHEYIPPDVLPATIQGVFGAGCCTVWSHPIDSDDEPQMVAAIPATNDQTNELADLMEIAAIDPNPEDIALKAYYVKRDELCAPLGYQRCSILFKSQMEAQMEAENHPKAKYRKLASAAKFN